jgi:hypothetical protein
MLPAIHYAGRRKIAERYGRGERLILHHVALREPALIRFSSGRLSVDLFVFVRNKVRGVQLSFRRTLHRERITAYDAGAASWAK